MAGCVRNDPRLPARQEVIVEFTDRYQALGIPYPDTATMCTGQCDGTGWVPVYAHIDYVDGLLYMPDNETPDDARYAKPWLEAHKKCQTRKWWQFWKEKHSVMGDCDGWHFIKCLDCGGTGKKQ